MEGMQLRRSVRACSSMQPRCSPLVAVMATHMAEQATPASSAAAGNQTQTQTQLTAGGDDGHALDHVAHAVADRGHARQRVEGKLVVEVIQQAHTARGCGKGNSDPIRRRLPRQLYASGSPAVAQLMAAHSAELQTGLHRPASPVAGPCNRCGCSGPHARMHSCSSQQLCAPEQRAVELGGALLSHLLLDGRPHALLVHKDACGVWRAWRRGRQSEAAPQQLRRGGSSSSSPGKRGCRCLQGTAQRCT